MVAHTLVEVPADSPVWPECAAARRPVGYFLNVIDRWLVQFDPADPNDVQADAQDRVEPEEADREDVAA